MSELHSIINPRINTNEDQSQVVEISVKIGQFINVGDHIATVESTKAALEIISEVTGELVAINCTLGEMVDVGAPLFNIRVNGADSLPKDVKMDPVETEEIKISAKARRRAKDLGININEVLPRNGKVQVNDVDDFHLMQNDKKSTKIYLGVPAVIVGGGGHAGFVIDCLRNTPVNLVGCTDFQKVIGEKLSTGHDIIGDDSILPQLFNDGVRTAYVGVGGATDNSNRTRIYNTLVELGFYLPPIIHPSAIIGFGSTIGYGTLIGPGASIGPGCQIGNNVIVNQGAIVSHDCVIEDHVHLTPGSIIAGSVSVGTGSTVGMAATVLFGKKVGQNCLVHNGASVRNNLPSFTEYLLDGTRRKNNV